MRMTPQSGPEWEPEWMRALREIDAHISAEVERYVRERYVRWRKMETWWWFATGFGGYWVGFGTAELFKWWTGIH